MAENDLTFVRFDLGWALLASLTSGLGVALAALWGEESLILTVLGGVVAFVALWHLGWRLAFPGWRSSLGDMGVLLAVGLVVVVAVAIAATAFLGLR